MIAVDTSVVVAAFATWHERHAVARATYDALVAAAAAHAGATLATCDVRARRTYEAIGVDYRMV